MVLVERRAVGRDSVLWLGTVLDVYVQILSLCLLGVLPDNNLGRLPGTVSADLCIYRSGVSLM